MPVRTAAVLSEELGIPGISKEVAIRATDKIEMIKAFQKHQVPSPKFWIVENDASFQRQKRNWNIRLFSNHRKVLGAEESF